MTNGRRFLGLDGAAFGLLLLLAACERGTEPQPAPIPPTPAPVSVASS